MVLIDLFFAIIGIALYFTYKVLGTKDAGKTVKKDLQEIKSLMEIK